MPPSTFTAFMGCLTPKPHWRAAFVYSPRAGRCSLASLSSPEVYVVENAICLSGNLAFPSHDRPGYVFVSADPQPSDLVYIDRSVHVSFL
ncbi:hypothetical protein FA13DRAFT_1736439 [Coprinellus micaceus]|uniref:Uncharacterized protein n=1 Tax=Coprinellus micaceus TaxID=71717 RepID=A0A4Y7T0C6_COPMI|nr:hypothetical protein FA13DRAFT_1736439 [Coprinellus micaceus]